MAKLHPTGLGTDPGGSTRVAVFSRVFMIVTLTLAALLLAWFARGVLLVAFAGLLAAVFLYHIAMLLHRLIRLPYWATLTITCVALLGLLVGMFWLMGARLLNETDALSQQLPVAWEKFRSYLDSTAWGSWLRQRVEQTSQSAQTSALMQRSATFLSASVGAIAGVLAIAFIGLFGAISPQLYVRGFVRLFPLHKRPLVRHLLVTASGVIWWWILGQLISMAFIAVLTGVTIWLLGVPLALTLAFLAALMNFIPNFGPLIAAVPAMLLAFLISPITALWVAIAYIIIQILQNNVVTPLVMQKATRLPPALLLVGQLVLYLIGGVLGMLLAPPLIAVAVRWIDILWVKRSLNDPQRVEEGFWPDGAQQPLPSSSSPATEDPP